MALYLPLIDKNPSHPDSTLSAMVEAERFTKQCGQYITVLTNDQQLYKDAVNVKWVYPERFAYFILGYAYVMSFICVGVLKADTAYYEIMFWRCCKLCSQVRSSLRSLEPLDL